MFSCVEMWNNRKNENKIKDRLIVFLFCKIEKWKEEDKIVKNETVDAFFFIRPLFSIFAK